MSAYYNEYDKGAAAWLRQLINRNLIAPGEVDERSIVDVRPADLRGFTQCHFFSGIGVWSHALRLAGVPDDTPIWTGSCPCQPFSAAGAGAGIADARHLWPQFFRLISECRPATVIGEQVGGKAGYSWLDHVFADLEEHSYACAAADFPAAGVGAPHIRQRLYWCANRDHPTDGTDLMGDTDDTGSQGWGERRNGTGERSSGSSGMADPWSDAIWIPCRDGKSRPVGRGISPLVVGNAKGERQRADQSGSDSGEGQQLVGTGTRIDLGNGCGTFVVGNAGAARLQGGERIGLRGEGWQTVGITETGERFDGNAGPTESGSIPLADGSSAGMGPSGDIGASEDPLNTSEARVMRLKGYGNALVAPAAQAFIEAAMECIA